MSRTFGTLSLDRGYWTLQAEPHVMQRVRRWFACADTHGAVQLTDTSEHCEDLRFLLGRYPLDVQEADRKRLTCQAEIFVQQHHDLEQIAGGHLAPDHVDLALPPRDYQAQAAEIAYRTRGLLLADELGLGKTCTSIALLSCGDTLPAVVVCYPHLQRQWQRELQKFAPGLFAHAIKTSAVYELPRFMGHPPDVLILTYHKLSSWCGVLCTYCKTVIFDECQELRRPKSAKWEAGKAIADACTWRMGLSATPIYNYGGEVFWVMDVLKPGCMGSREEFTREWCSGYSYGREARLQDPAAFGTWAREQFLIMRRTRTEVGRELPAVERVVQECDADTSKLKQISDRAHELASLVLDMNGKWHERGQAAEELTTVLRQATGIAKAPFVAEFVAGLVETGERVVLCGWHREVYTVWKARFQRLGISAELYTGTESPAAKERAREAFLGGSVQVLMLSLRSGAGLDGLQEACRVIVFGELDWSPGVHEQCVGRLHRDGQDQAVLAYYLTAESGSDPIVADVLGIKREQASGVSDPTAALVQTQDAPHALRLAQHVLGASRYQEAAG